MNALQQSSELASKTGRSLPMMSERESISEPTLLREKLKLTSQSMRGDKSQSLSLWHWKWSSGEVTEERAGSTDKDSGSKLLTPCNKLQLTIGCGRHITDISKRTFNYYQDGGLAKQEVQLKSTMGNLVHDKWLVKAEDNSLKDLLVWAKIPYSLHMKQQHFGVINGKGQVTISQNFDFRYSIPSGVSRVQAM